MELFESMIAWHLVHGGIHLMLYLKVYLIYYDRFNNKVGEDTRFRNKIKAIHDIMLFFD